MEEISNNLETNETRVSKYNWYENNENMPQNEQLIKFHDHIEHVSDEFDEGGEHLNENEDKATITDANSYDLEDFDTARTDTGEPLAPQYISIDFTPVRGVDDVESLQEKCLGFWKFVNENPNLQRLSNKGFENHNDDYLSGEVRKQNPRQVKLKKRYNERVGQQSLPELKSEMSLSNRLSRTSYQVSDEVDKLCHEMKNWDKLHPKSMKSPKTLKFNP